MSVHEKITDMYTRLITIGGMFYVDEDGYVLQTDDDKPVTFKVDNKTRPLRMYAEKMSAGEFTILNPMAETLGICNERIWFYGVLRTVLSATVLKMVEELCTRILDEDAGEIPYEWSDVVSPIADRVDKKTLTELASIKRAELLTIFYDRKKKIAQLQMLIDHEGFDEKYKLRKKTKAVLRALVEGFLGSDDIEKDYTVRRQHIGYPEFDARIGVFLAALQSIVEYATVLEPEGSGWNINEEMVSALTQHYTDAETYHNACKWAATASVSATSVTKDDDEQVSISEMLSPSAQFGQPQQPQYVPPVADAPSRPVPVTQYAAGQRMAVPPPTPVYANQQPQVQQYPNPNIGPGYNYTAAVQPQYVQQPPQYTQVQPPAPQYPPQPQYTQAQPQYPQYPPQPQYTQAQAPAPQYVQRPPAPQPNVGGYEQPQQQPHGSSRTMQALSNIRRRG